MNRLTYAKREFNNAKEALLKMENTQKFIEFEKNWKDFLGYIEKLWNKAERECQHVKEKFKPFQGVYTNRRKKDPLLSYMKQARHADTHSIQEIIANKSGGGLKLHEPAQSVTIQFTVKEGGDIVFHNSDKPGTVVYVFRVEAKTVLNNGEVYYAPQYHLKKPIKDNLNPINLAKLTLEFYETFLITLEEKLSSWEK